MVMESESAHTAGGRLARILAAIPTHHQSPHTIDQIADALQYADAGQARVAVEIVVAWLRLFNLLTQSNGGYRTSNQAATYFLNSLIWYVRYELPLLGDWARLGVKGDPTPGEILDKPAYFLKLSELRRLRLAEAADLTATPSREQDVAFVLVQGTRGGDVYYLHQFDSVSAHDQLIGGRIEPGETPEQAAHREFSEELGEMQRPPLVREHAYRLQPLLGEPIVGSAMSDTYGALTSYRFYVFGVHLNVSSLRLSPNDRWISVGDMLANDVNTDVYRQIDRRLPDGLRGIALKGVSLEP
jgi:8-oxo-dGTP pyrophosphatase MutT (NUDIX family)